ncbi:MAG: hypothetical protein RLZZ09_2311 [Pseudomonadota bacterium]|jgi:two-component system sensor histidine kinase BaeS
MNLRLSTRLFLAILLSLLLPLGVMMASVHWSFRKGFEDYLHQQEVERLGRLAGLLVEAYRAQGSWDALKDDHHAWMALLHRGLTPQPGNEGMEPPPPPPPPEHHHPHPGHPPDFRPPPPRDQFALILRMHLLDANQQRLIGPPPDPVTGQALLRPASRLPMAMDGNIIGWLEVERSPVLTDRLAQAFMEQQAQINLLILLLALSIATLASVLLSRQILRPLRRIAVGTRTLADGRYDVSLPVSQDELGELAQDFNHLAVTLHRHESARRRWIADISHELRTPLAVLRGEIEALLDGIRQPTPDRIASLHTEVKALHGLVEDLYDLSLSDLGALNYRRQAINLTDVIRQVADTYVPRFADKAISLHTKLEDPVRINGDPARLAQLLGNLLENSYRYTDAGGQCHLTLTQEGNQAIMTLEDSAPGVPEAALPRIFDRLYRVDESRSRAHGGSGLGLAIAANIVTAHGGRLRAEQAALGGLRIVLELPLLSTEILDRR